jgi:hypothetical protein
MIRIVFFDLATLTGFAVGSAETGVEEYGSLRLPKTAEDYGEWLKTALATFSYQVGRIKPDSVWYEQPNLPDTTSIVTLRKLYTLPPALELAAQRAKIRHIRESHRGEILTHFLGAGKVPKRRAAKQAAVKVKARARGWEPKDDNEADALAGLDYAIACMTPDYALKGTGLLGDMAR